MNSTTTEQLEEKAAELEPVGVEDNVVKTNKKHTNKYFIFYTTYL